MSAFQYPNHNKQEYSGILHQERTPDVPHSEAKLIPIAYFSGSFSKTQQLWNTTQKNVMPSINQWRNLLFTLQAWSAHYTVSINP